MEEEFAENEISCLECHDMTHAVDEVEELELWGPLIRYQYRVIISRTSPLPTSRAASFRLRVRGSPFPLIGGLLVGAGITLFLFALVTYR